MLTGNMYREVGAGLSVNIGCFIAPQRTIDHKIVTLEMKYTSRIIFGLHAHQTRILPDKMENGA